MSQLFHGWFAVNYVCFYIFLYFKASVSAASLGVFQSSLIVGLLFIRTTFYRVLSTC